MKSNQFFSEVKQSQIFQIKPNQIAFCIALLLCSCSSKSKNQWNCSEPLPLEFKIVQNKTGDKYAIQFGRSQRRVDRYEEKRERYEYTYYYLGENERGWVVQVPVGGERQFDDSCGAKDYFALFAQQNNVLEERTRRSLYIDSINQNSHTY